MAAFSLSVHNTISLQASKFWDDNGHDQHLLVLLVNVWWLFLNGGPKCGNGEFYLLLKGILN